MTKSDKEKLKSLNPCDDGFKWFAKQKSPEIAWNNCVRSDWMLWAIEKIGYNNKKTLRLLACRFVRDTIITDGKTVWDILPDDRSRNAVITSEKYANGEATKEKLSAARDAAGAAAWDAAGEQQANIIREMIRFENIGWYNK